MTDLRPASAPDAGRHWAVLSRTRALVVALAAMTVAGALSGCTGATTQEQGPPVAASAAPVVSLTRVLAEVRAAAKVTKVPDSVQVALTRKDDASALGRATGCEAPSATIARASLGNCVYGDPNGSRTMAIYGDSHAYMWAVALRQIALRDGWKLRIFALSDCPVADLHFQSSETRAPSKACDEFHAAAVKQIDKIRPDVVFTTSTSIAKTNPLADGSYPTEDQWSAAWSRTLSQLKPSGAKLALIGDIPSWPNDGPDCLAAHLSDAQRCTVSRAAAIPPYTAAERSGAKAAGALVIDTTPWVCGTRCYAVIDGQRVYGDQFHLYSAYTVTLSGALKAAARSVLE